jgi:copper homeostasis protein
MNPPVLVEACVDTIGSALAAQAGGAHRVELCANLIEGGTTPSAGTLAVARAALTIPIYVLVRPRGGDFLYGNDELAVMAEDITRAKEAGADGVVIGALLADGTVHADAVSRLIACARPLAVTFHRAFDVCRDRDAALKTLIALGAERVLTSGGAATAPDGAAEIARLVSAAAGRIGILPGGGITADNVADLVQATGVTEVHLTGARTRRSRMAHRHDDVVIGNTPPRNEYDWSETDSEVIRSVVEGLQPGR